MPRSPETLETVGVVEYEDEVDGIVTSPHPHIDSATGDWLNTTISFSRACAYNLFRVPAGTRRREIVARLPVREPAYMHSFSQTERYVVLAEYPLVVSPMHVLLSGKTFAENLRWKAGRPTCFLVLDKRDGKLVARRVCAPFFSFHHVNAHERDGELVVDLLAYPDASAIQKHYIDVLRRPGENVAPVSVAELRRYRVPLAPSDRGPIEYETQTDEPMELPRINYERCSGRPYRYVYGVGLQRHSAWVDQLVKVDVGAGGCGARVWHEPGCYPGEPVFVAAPSTTAEDEGIVLSVVLDAERGSSFLLVLDAGTFGELARARVPHRIPAGFHGQHFPT